VAEANVTLEYASRQSWMRRRWRRMALMVLLVCALAAGLWYRHDIDWAVRRGWLLQAQRQCLNFNMLPTRVAYEEDAARSVELLSSHGDYRPAKLDAAGQRVGAMWWPKEVQNYPEASRYFSGQSGDAALLFLHERKTRSGLAVLVCAMAWMDRTGSYPLVRFGVRAVTPATWQTDLQTAGGLGAFPIDVVRYYERTPLRMYGGQPDAADASRFTVEYELNGRRGSLEGRVKDAARQPGSSNLPVEIEFDVRPGGPSR
jgi:hypothetical protein